MMGRAISRAEQLHIGQAEWWASSRAEDPEDPEDPDWERSLNAHGGGGGGGGP